mmetsp:Transcript_24286/g.66442  ORF Transcript_24286/g.66442 Transcript_24286/m.66442 type:complete len:82 (+) Transcript_24286:1457-1702(+)|eukprot:1162003-Pelagomonas_calceolata.AAC.13
MPFGWKQDPVPAQAIMNESQLLGSNVQLQPITNQGGHVCIQVHIKHARSGIWFAAIYERRHRATGLSISNPLLLLLQSFPT